jgi:dynein heavy chain
MTLLVLADHPGSTPLTSLFFTCISFSTLERHFKNLSHGSVSAVLDSLPSMMNAIRMVRLPRRFLLFLTKLTVFAVFTLLQVWVISRHYNTDDRMVPLMELIAGQISSKVSWYMK